MRKQMNIWEFIERNKPFVQGATRDVARLVIIGGIFFATASNFDADEIVQLLLVAGGLLGVRGLKEYRDGRNS